MIAWLCEHIDHWTLHHNKVNKMFTIECVVNEEIFIVQDQGLIRALQSAVHQGRKRLSMASTQPNDPVNQ